MKPYRKIEIGIVPVGLIAVLILWLTLGTTLEAADVFGAALPLLAGAMGAFVTVKPPQQHELVWFAGFVALGLAGFGFQLRQANQDKVDKGEATRQYQTLLSQNQKLIAKVGSLGTVSALRKQVADLAIEINEFGDRATSDGRQILGSDGTSDAAEEKIFFAFARKRMRDYHAKFDSRIRNILTEVSIATGKDTTAILKATTTDAGEMAISSLNDIAGRLNALAGSLP